MSPANSTVVPIVDPRLRNHGQASKREEEIDSEILRSVHIVDTSRHEYQYELQIKRKHRKNLLLPFMGSFRASSAWRIMTPPESALAPFWPLESHGRTRTSSLSLRSLLPFFCGGSTCCETQLCTLQLKASSAPPALSASRLLRSLRLTLPRTSSARPSKSSGVSVRIPTSSRCHGSERTHRVGVPPSS